MGIQCGKKQPSVLFLPLAPAVTLLPNAAHPAGAAGGQTIFISAQVLVFCFTVDKAFNLLFTY